MKEEVEERLIRAGEPGPSRGAEYERRREDTAICHDDSFRPTPSFPLSFDRLKEVCRRSTPLFPLFLDGEPSRPSTVQPHRFRCLRSGEPCERVSGPEEGTEGTPTPSFPLFPIEGGEGVRRTISGTEGVSNGRTEAFSRAFLRVQAPVWRIRSNPFGRMTSKSKQKCHCD